MRKTYLSLFFLFFLFFLELDLWSTLRTTETGSLGRPATGTWRAEAGAELRERQQNLASGDLARDRDLTRAGQEGEAGIQSHQTRIQSHQTRQPIEPLDGRGATGGGLQLRSERGGDSLLL
jgi:hypothetical protein